MFKRYAPIVAALFALGLAACTTQGFQNVLLGEKLFSGFVAAALAQYDSWPACGTAGSNDKFCFDANKSKAAHASLVGFNQSIAAAEAALADPSEPDEQRRLVFAAVSQAESLLVTAMSVIPIVVPAASDTLP